jgi:hypothetical protein
VTLLQTWRSPLTARRSTNAAAFAYDDVVSDIDAGRAVLERDDITQRQRAEIAVTFTEQVRAVAFEVDHDVDIEKAP